jgi:hypothetical protein
LAALQVAKELVQSIVPTLAVVGMVCVLSLAQRIVHIAIRMRVCRLRRRVGLIVLRRTVCVSAIDGTDGALKIVSSGSIT